MCSYVAIHILVGLLDPFKNYVINQFIRKKKTGNSKDYFTIKILTGVLVS